MKPQESVTISPRQDIDSTAPIQSGHESGSIWHPLARRWRAGGGLVISETFVRMLERRSARRKNHSQSHL